MFPGAVRWWGLPAAVHVAALAAFGAAVWVLVRSLLRQAVLPRAAAGRILAAAVVLLGIFLCLNQFSEMENVVSRVTDFGPIHQGAEALFSGGDPSAAPGGAYFYPPLTAFLFGLFAWLPPAGASLLFFTLKFIMLAWTLAACDRLADGGQFSGGRRVLFVFGLIFVASRFWIADMQFGNTNVPVLFLMVGAIAWDRDDHSWASGLALALAVAVKIVPMVLVLHFLVLGRWRTLGWLAAAVGGSPTSFPGSSCRTTGGGPGRPISGRGWPASCPSAWPSRITSPCGA